MKNFNAIDLVIYKDTMPHRKYNRRLQVVHDIVEVLDKASEPMTAHEISDAIKCPDEGYWERGGGRDTRCVTHALTRLVILGLAKVVGSREVWYNVDEDTKKRGEIRLYSLA